MEESSNINYQINYPQRLLRIKEDDLEFNYSSFPFECLDEYIDYKQKYGSSHSVILLKISKQISTLFSMRMNRS